MFPDPSIDLATWAQTVLDAATGEGGIEWRILVLLALSGVVAAARHFGGKVSPWFKTDRAGVLLTLLTAIFGGLYTAFVAGEDFTPQLALQALLNAVAAGGGFAMVKRLLGKSEAQKSGVQ